MYFAVHFWSPFLRRLVKQQRIQKEWVRMVADVLMEPTYHRSPILVASRSLTALHYTPFRSMNDYFGFTVAVETRSGNPYSVGSSVGLVEHC